MFWILVLVLILSGFLFLVLEILVIPGTGIAGVIGFVLIAIGVWQGYAHYGTPMGHYILGGTIVTGVVSLVLALRAKTWRKLMLDSAIESQVNVIEADKVSKGDQGVAISRLAPSGKAIINGEYFEVRTTGEFLDEGSELLVLKVENNHIFVIRKK